MYDHTVYEIRQSCGTRIAATKSAVKYVVELRVNVHLVYFGSTPVHGQSPARFTNVRIGSTSDQSQCIRAGEPLPPPRHKQCTIFLGTSGSGPPTERPPPVWTANFGSSQNCGQSLLSVASLWQGRLPGVSIMAIEASHQSTTTPTVFRVPPAGPAC